jgi:phage terminase large subunit-like protein
MTTAKARSRGDVIIRGTLDNAWKIEFPDTNSKFQSLANGENISGPRPCFVLADEIHEFKKRRSDWMEAPSPKCRAMR